MTAAQILDELNGILIATWNNAVPVACTFSDLEEIGFAGHAWIPSLIVGQGDMRFKESGKITRIKLYDSWSEVAKDFPTNG